MKTQNPYDDSLLGKSVQFHDDKGVACYGTILGPDKKAKNRIAYMVSRNGASAVGYYSRALYEVEILLIGETRDKPTARLRGDEEDDGGFTESSEQPPRVAGMTSEVKIISGYEDDPTAPVKLLVRNTPTARLRED